MFILVTNLFLIILFIKALYIQYFLLLGLISYYFYRRMKLSKYIVVLYLFFIVITPFFIRFFDEYIFEIYVSFGFDKYYISMDGEVSNILAFLHALILFGL